MKEKDILIVGQGLAGSALALTLKKRGFSLTVIDKENENSASLMAAGLVTTLAGKGMNPMWRQQENLSHALAFYRELEQTAGQIFFHHLPVVRLFANAKERDKFEKKKEKLREWWSENEPLHPIIKASQGYFTMARGGRLDTKNYLKAVRNYLGKDYQKGEMEQKKPEQFAGIKHKKIILCTGVEGLETRFFPAFAHRSAKGEMLTIELEKEIDLPEDKIINRNGWLVPLGNNQWRAGATYSWKDLNTTPTEQGKAEIEKKIASLIHAPYKILKHNAGIRPIVQQSQPIIGMSKINPNIGIFNGLGSRGVITAPAVAEHFADYLEGKTLLDPSLDYNRIID